MVKRVKTVINTPLKLAAAGAVGLLLAYAFASRAIDTGSLFQYFVTFMLLALSIKLLARSFKIYYGKE
jgi:hypothetical protein